jgi:hypothetical protein
MILISFEVSLPISRSSYYKLFKEQGWESSNSFECDNIFVTDTTFIAMYKYGSSEDSPWLCIGKNNMITEVDHITFFVKNCGQVKEVKSTTESWPEGCRILLPDQFVTPQ